MGVSATTDIYSRTPNLLHNKWGTSVTEISTDNVFRKMRQNPHARSFVIHWHILWNSPGLQKKLLHRERRVPVAAVKFRVTPNVLHNKWGTGVNGNQHQRRIWMNGTESSWIELCCSLPNTLKQFWTPKKFIAWRNCRSHTHYQIQCDITHLVNEESTYVNRNWCRRHLWENEG